MFLSPFWQRARSVAGVLCGNSFIWLPSFSISSVRHKVEGGGFNGDMLFLSASPHLDQALAFTSALGDVSFARAWAAGFSWG